MRRRLAILDADSDFAHSVRLAFERDGFDVEHYAKGEAALGSRPYDLVIVDDGLELCRRLRERSRDLGILVVSAQAEEPDRIAALEAGADDHIAKPASVREVVARANAVLRRRSNPVATPYSEEGLMILLDGSFVIRGSERIPLSRGEADVLSILLRASPAVVPVEKICAELSTPAAPVRRTTIDARVKSLRRKIGRARIETRAGFGYAFVPRT